MERLQQRVLAVVRLLPLPQWLLAFLALVKARVDDDRFRELAAKLADDRVRVLTPDRPAELVKRQRTPPAEPRPTRVPRLRRFGHRVWHAGSKLLELLDLIGPF